jgi:hypothetical protein
MTAKVIEAAHRFRKHDLPSEKYRRDLEELQKLMDERDRERITARFIARYNEIVEEARRIDYVNKGPLP